MIERIGSRKVCGGYGMYLHIPHRQTILQWEGLICLKEVLSDVMAATSFHTVHVCPTSSHMDECKYCQTLALDIWHGNVVRGCGRDDDWEIWKLMRSVRFLFE